MSPLLYVICGLLVLIFLLVCLCLWLMDKNDELKRGGNIAHLNHLQ